jgi:hypothetical protein
MVAGLVAVAGVAVFGCFMMATMASVSAQLIGNSQGPPAPSSRGMGLLLGWFERFRFRVNGLNLSRRCLGGCDDRTRLESHDDDGVCAPGTSW